MQQTKQASDVLIAYDGVVAAITMNCPERRNALSLAMMRTLTEALHTVSQRPETRAVVLRGEGPAFSAGHDLRELQGCNAASAREIFTACVTLMETIQAIPQPVIAEVAGVATAAGCQLVATCDLAVAAREAVFATPGVRIGLFCSTPMIALARAVGRKRALEMLLTGKPITARTAADWGLINAVVDRDVLAEATSSLARQIAEASPSTVGLGKAAFYETIDRPQSEAYARALEIMTDNAQDGNAQEGIAAFLEKRTAHFPS
jgi:enoyl-CoA hydratase/carnithine racemase